MADKIKKLLAKLSPKELQAVEQILKQLLSGDTDGLDIKQLKGTEHVFRARKGKLRIIYTKDKSGEVNILLIARRSEKTYRDF